VRLESGQSTKTRLGSIRPPWLPGCGCSSVVSGSPPRKLGETTVEGANEIGVVVSKVTAGLVGALTKLKPEGVEVAS